MMSFIMDGKNLSCWEINAGVDSGNQEIGKMGS
jgi:hypothetical protein